MAEATRALVLSFFAYLSVPQRPADFPRVISNYPSAWTEHYVRSHYEQLDSVIMHALSQPEPFACGIEMLGIGRRTAAFHSTCGSPAIDRPERSNGVHCLAMPNIDEFQYCNVWKTKN
jgi:hypothetical protein